MDDRERYILARLRPHGLTGAPTVSGFYHPDDQALMRDMERRGLVRTWPGEGKDRGLLLATLKANPPQLTAIDGKTS